LRSSSSSPTGSGDPQLADAVTELPGALDAATRLDWWPQLAPLARATSLYAVGRGTGLGAALEIALKLKETCRLHAEAFSAAELQHGPLALVDRGFPVLAVGQDDDSAATTRAAIARLVELGADVRSTLAVPGCRAVADAPDRARDRAAVPGPELLPRRAPARRCPQPRPRRPGGTCAR